MSNVKVDQATIRDTKTNIKLHGSLNSAVISMISPIQKPLNVFLLREIEALQSRGSLNPKKISKITKIRHKKLLNKIFLRKGNILRIIPCNNHAINIKDEKGPTMR